MRSDPIMKILLISTGGTIAMKKAEGEKLSTFAFDSSDFTQTTGMEGIVLENHSYSQQPSSSFDSSYAAGLTEFIANADSDYDAFVITHGTDTLEETAFYLEMVLSTERPVVLTGAMVTADKPGADGVANVMDAIRVAAAPESRGKGVLVVFARDILWGLYSRKVQTLQVRAFGSDHGGKLGRVEGDRVVYHYDTPPHRKLDNLLGGSVSLVKVYYDIEEAFLRHAYERSEAVVIEGLGSGRIPERLLTALDDFTDKLTLITTRVQDGGLYDEYSFGGSYQELSSRPVIFSPFDALKTCILARLAHGNGLDREGLNEFLEGFWSLGVESEKGLEGKRR